MPRHPQVHAEGLLYHVIDRGNDGQKIFLRQSDCQAFIEALRTVRQRYPFSLYAYVLMSNHFHRPSRDFQARYYFARADGEAS